MPDGDGRLARVEQHLDTLGERIEEGFAQVDQRFAQVDQRFAQVDQRFAQVDQRFAQVDQRFAQVDQRFAQVDQRFEQIDGRLGSLETEVQKLRLLGEQNTTDIKQIAEVQAHHGDIGAALKRIEEALEPLKALPAAIHTCFRDLSDHERRITALEDAGHTTPET
jgi:chromosome segregation ATPase